MVFNTCRAALIQIGVTANKALNLEKVEKFIHQAVEKGANLIILPECFNSPYGVEYFPKYAEPVPTGASSQLLSRLARETKTWIVGGSIPEQNLDATKFYNTSTIWSPTGELLACHRKVHLFNINVPGKITFDEGKTVTAGNQITVIKTAIGTIGVGICYDIRFPELCLSMVRQGAEILVFPGAFNMTTGPLHWEALARARAIDNQCYVLMCSPARDVTASYVAWGHSMIVDPRGQVIETLNEEEGILYSDLHGSLVQEFRSEIPVLFQRRFDVYQDVLKEDPSK